MKRNLLLSAMLFTACTLFAQQPVITFDKTEHDFGKIQEADGRVTTVFEFKNEGMEPLVLSNVRASCGCTTPTWTKTPVEPGEKGAITVTYNPNGRPGRFQKTITITSNATEPTKKVFIKGEVIPKAAKPVNKYPEKMGDLSLTAKTANFGVVKKGQTVDKVIEYANLSEEELKVDIFYKEDESFDAQPSLLNVKKGESGQLLIRFDTEKGNKYGPQESALYVVVNGKKQVTDEYKIVVKADVEEDFSSLTPEQLQNAPILEVAPSVDLGVITPGKKVKKNISFSNAGASPLIVRALINSSTDMFTAAARANTLKSGKKGNIVVELNGKLGGDNLKAGEYHRIITLITNDPKNPKQQIKINWVVAEVK